MLRGFEVVRDEFRKYPDKEIIVPEHATENSAGLDIATPVQLIIPPQGRAVIATDLKAFMPKNEYLAIHIRSSVGIKQNVKLTNVTGIIDMDYYSNEDNDGNIHLALTNEGNETVIFKEGDRIAQGIFQEFKKVENTNSKTNPPKKRKGGIGHTGK